MKGNNLQKLARVIGFLACNPTELPRYLTASLGKQTPLELELPWISYAAIEHLDQFLTRNHSVAEFGGGGSTLFFAKRVKHVLCIESQKEWASKIAEALAQQSLTNVLIETIPYDCQDLQSYKGSDNLHRIDRGMFDVILVDGYEADVELRPACFWHAEDHVNAGGIIIVDDAWRYPMLRQENKAKRWSEFRSIGPCRPGVTMTDIYYY